IAGNTLTLTQSLDTTSALIYYNNNIPCTVTVNSINNVNPGVDRIELKKAIIDYQLKDDVDDGSCNGLVNFSDGCVLFNERLIAGQSGYSRLTYNADMDNSDGTPNAIDSPFNSNSLLKVTPDRDCDKWLACRSYIKDSNNNNVCYDIGLCDSFDNNGHCNSFVVPNSPGEQLAFDFGGAANTFSASYFSDSSGYVKAAWHASSLGGDYYSLDEMEQKGEVARVSNGGFELAGSNLYPLGWIPIDALGNEVSWDINKFSVIDNPISAQEEGIKYPADGRNFLKWSPSEGVAHSDPIDVEPNTEYVLSALMNSLGYHPSDTFDFTHVTVGILTYDADGVRVGYDPLDNLSNYDILECGASTRSMYNGCVVSLRNAQDWTRLSKRFKVGSYTDHIKIRIKGTAFFAGYQDCTRPDGSIYQYYPWAFCEYRGSYTVDTTQPVWNCTDGQILSREVSSDTCAGNVYIDDIKVMPALEVKDSEDLPQTCRLYPEDDALSCAYYDDSWAWHKGWTGYCLEYDHYPGSSDACLLWYPIDMVKGDGIEEGAGYLGRFPLYYSLGMGYEELSARSDEKSVGVMRDPDTNSRINCGNTDLCAIDPEYGEIIAEAEPPFVLSDFEIPTSHYKYLTPDNIISISGDVST
ncbi:MAG: hypothetical protein GY839_06440, partial [candidate division Zixibacteria bacterium]|nr:hypothetical protein [candidate division Zixibacteria bacterium]